MKVIAVALMLALMPVSALAQRAAFFVRADRLQNLCDEKADPGSHRQCVTYLMAAADAWNAEKIATGRGNCVPGNVSGGALMDAFNRFIEANPEDLKYSAINAAD